MTVSGEYLLIQESVLAIHRIALLDPEIRDLSTIACYGYPVNIGLGSGLPEVSELPAIIRGDLDGIVRGRGTIQFQFVLDTTCPHGSHTHTLRRLPPVYLRLSPSIIDASGHLPERERGPAGLPSRVGYSRQI